MGDLLKLTWYAVAGLFRSLVFAGLYHLAPEV
jgi:hypothetical protein